MARQLEVNLSFTADSAKAKAQIQDLQKSLNNLMKNTGISTSDNVMTQFNKETVQANKNVAQLQVALKNSVNQKTGRLDLSKFNESLKSSNLSLNQVKDSLVSLGPEGERAFIKVAQSVMQADTSLRTSNKLVNDLWISLKNTAKWQLSSSIVKGFMGAMSTAFGYAEDLNKSLNQIQIVTGNSAEQMAQFAKQANIAAKELSTTTTAYTDASLIYYQQGLDEDSVKARTDITIKAANAAGTNAEEMADYLTAVWNSYKVGSNELERYVDIMAALGAGTATSLEEISTAMEKVASVGEAVGVKFEQMSSIIATVSSVTRQSAETVGTAFKTIFARMADLELEGSIEEDGVTTTLGSVSSQLASVGVNILTANGELRDMGDVMEELMSKWGSMNTATQQAVAIAVAGKRQYTQLLALMNNQDMYRDAMGMASDSEGTLQKQADTYAKSWEAAQKRVKAAAQGIYDSLINDDFFIDINDGLAGLLGTIENYIDSIGGLKGLVLQIGAIFSNIFSKQIAESIGTATNQLKMFTSAGRQVLEAEAQAQRTQAQRLIENVLVNSTTFSSGEVEADSIKRQNNLYGLYIDNAKKMNEEQRQTVQYLLDQQNILEKNVVKQAELANQAKSTAEAQAMPVLSGLQSNKGQFDNLYDRYSQRSQEASNASMLKTQITSIGQNSTEINNLKKYIDQLQITITNTGSSFKDAFGTSIANKIEQLSKKMRNLDSNAKIDKVTQELKELQKVCDQNIASFEKLNNEINETGSETIEELAIQTANSQNREVTDEDYEDASNAIATYTAQINESSQAQTENINVQMNAEQRYRTLTQQVTDLSNQTPKTAQGFVVLGNVIMSTFSGISSIVSIFSTLSNPDLTGIQKFQAILMGLPMVFMTVTSLMKLFNAENKAMTINSLAAALGIKVKTEASEADTAATVAETIATLGLKGALDSLTASNPILLAIAAALMVAIGAFIAIKAIIDAYNKSILKSAENTQKAVEENQKLQEETENLSNDIQELTTSLEEQRNAGEDISDTYSNLTSKLDDIRENYKKLGVSDTTLQMLEQAEAVGLATDNWSQYNKVKEQADKESAKKSAKLAKANTNAQLNAARVQFAEGDGKKSGVRHVGDVGSHKDVADILNKEQYKDILKGFNGSDDGKLTIDFNNPSKFLKDYKALGEVIHELEREGKTTSDTYRELKEEFDNLSETASNLENSFDELSLSELNNTLENNNINAEDIQTLDQYMYTLQLLTKETRGLFGSTEEAVEKAKEYLNTFSNTSEGAVAFAFLDRFNQKLSTAVKTSEQMKQVQTISAPDQQVEPVYEAVEEITLKYDENSIKEEYEKMYNYINSLSDEKKEIAFNINLDYIDSVDEFKNTLNKTLDFEQKVKITIDPEETIASAKSLRDNFSDIMETFSEQGYLTTTQAINFIDEYPQYSQYLVQTAKGYALSQEAVDKFNNALSDEKKALEELTNPTNIGGQALVNFGKNLISVENAIENENIKDFITNIEDLTLAFTNGEIEEKEFFDTFNSSLQSINFDKITQLDAMNYTSKVIPELINGITSYSNAMTDAFDAGRIGAEEYRNSLRNTANITLALVENNQKAIMATKEFSSSLKQVNGEYEPIKAKKYSKEVQDMADSLNKSAKQARELQEALDDLNDFEPINIAATENYDALQEIFAEDFSIEIDDSQLDDAIKKTEKYRDSIADSFAALDQIAQENVIDKILEIGEGLENVGQDAYNFQTNMTTSFANISNGAARADTNVEQAAIDMLNGTYDSSVNSTELTANAMGLILKSGADTSSLVSQTIANVIENMGKLIDNFNAKISFAPTIGDLVEVGKIPFTDIPIKIPSFGIAIKGKLVGDTATAAKDLIQGIGSLAQINLSSSAGTMSSFKPKSIAGSPNNIQLDSPPEKSKSKKDKSGSGKSSSPEKADLENLDEAITRYKNIDNQLSSIENHLDKISHKKEQAYGKKYIAALDEENEALQKQIDLHKQSQQDAIKYQQQDKAIVASLGFNIETDEFGYVTNEEQFERWVTENKNRIETNYANSVNALGEDSDDQKNALQDQKDAELERIELAETYFNLYTEATERRYKDESAIEETLSQIRENNFDKINHAYEVQADLLGREEKQVERLRKTFREGLFGLANNTDADNSLIGKNLKQLDKIENKKKALDEAFATGAISESQYIEGLKNVDDEAGDVYDSIIELSDAIGDRFIEALNEADDIMDKSIAKFNHLRTIMNSVENLIKLTYGEEDFDALGDVYENIAYASEKELKYNKEMFEERKKTMDEARRQYNEALAGNIPEGKTLDQLKENLDEAENSVRDWQEKMYASAEEFTQDIINVYQNRVNKAMKQLENDLTGGSTFDQLKKELEMLQVTDTDYLTGVNQQYETQKMIRTATNALESASNKMAKEKLNLFIEETKELQKKDRLSEYELGLQQRKYEIALAEIALQEAQNNKSQVRLQRDSEGNFNYVYTADEDKVGEAQQQYEDAQNDLYNYAREKENEIQQARLENWENFYNEINELSLDQTLTEEEFQEKFAEIRSRYLERDMDLTEQANLTKEYSNQSYLDSFTINIADQIASTNEAKIAQKTAAAEVIDANNELKEKTTEYTNIMDQDYIDVKKNADFYAEGVEKDMGRTTSALEAVQSQTSVWANSMTTLLDNVAGRYNNLSNACQNAMETISGFFADTDYSLMWQNASSWDEALYAAKTREFMVQNNIAGKGQWLANSEGGLDLYDIWNQAQIIQNSTNLEEIIKAVWLRESKMQTANGLYDDQISTQKLLKDTFGENTDLYKQIIATLRAQGVPGFDTGGYTGEFGPEARIGLLHEKLVLNQNDTQNLLDTIDIVDKLLNSLEHQNLLQTFDISNIQGNNSSDILEQEVTIHAEFPNVQDRNEIEEALSNLVNTASQYANRKKR